MSILCTSLVSLVGSINSVVMDRDVDLDSVENRERVDIVRNALKMHSYLLSTAVSRMYRDVVQPTKSKGSKSKNAVSAAHVHHHVESLTRIFRRTIGTF